MRWKEVCIAQETGTGLAVAVAANTAVAFATSTNLLRDL